MGGFAVQKVDSGALAGREPRACGIQSEGCRCVAFGNVFAGEG